MKIQLPHQMILPIELSLLQRKFQVMNLICNQLCHQSGDWITRPVQKDSHDQPGDLIRSAAKMINWWIELQFFSFSVVHHIIPFFYHRYSKTFDEVSTRGGAIVIDKLIPYMLLLTVQAEQELRDCESLLFILQVYTMYFLFLPVLVLYFLCCSFFLLSSVSPYLEVFLWLEQQKRFNDLVLAKFLIVSFGDFSILMGVNIVFKHQVLQIYRNIF